MSKVKMLLRQAKALEARVKGFGDLGAERELEGVLKDLRKELALQGRKRGGLRLVA